MLPHLGLGGSLSVDGATVLAEVLLGALDKGDTSVGALSEFQRRYGARVAHARRACELWALGCTMYGFRTVRDLNFWRLRRRPQTLQAFVDEMAGHARPGMRTRWSVWLP
jgi:2-octaprenyl-6-methoxyphenol hydroxylase